MYHLVFSVEIKDNSIALLRALGCVLASCVCDGKKTYGSRGNAAKTADTRAAVTAFVST
jgi:hypothetical protein